MLIDVEIDMARSVRMNERELFLHLWRKGLDARKIYTRWVRNGFWEVYRGIARPPEIASLLHTVVGVVPQYENWPGSYPESKEIGE